MKKADAKSIAAQKRPTPVTDLGAADAAAQQAAAVLTDRTRGVAVADNQNSLKAGLRGPTLLEDFILREKITHFDHERIPERIVHARGSAPTATSRPTSH
jgi:catalase